MGLQLSQGPQVLRPVPPPPLERGLVSTNLLEKALDPLIVVDGPAASHRALNSGVLRRASTRERMARSISTVC